MTNDVPTPKPSTARRSLRRRTVIAVISTLFVTMALLIVFSQTIVKQGFEKVEDRDVRINVDRIRDAFTMQLENVDVKIIDWSVWDDAYQYMQDGNVAFEKSSLAVGALLGMKFELFVWRLPDGQIRWGRVFDLDKSTDLPLDKGIVDFFNANPELFAFKNEGDRRTSIVNLPYLGPTFLAIQPIVTSEGKGPIAGSLIGGRALNAAMVERLEKLTHLDLVLRTPAQAASDQSFAPYLSSLKSSKDTVLQPISEQTISAYTMFQDLFGKPVAYVKMKAPREIHEQGKSTVFAFFAALGLASLALGGVILLMLERNVVSRVTRLSSELTALRRSADLSLRVVTFGNDEISDLSNATNEMLESIEAGNNAIAARNNDMKLILDNAEQGFLNVALDGSLLGERSAIVDRWLGTPEAEVKIWNFLHRNQTKAANMFRMGWEQLLEDFMPFDVVADQMPCRVQIGDEIFQAKMRPVMREQKLVSILVVVSNITEAVKAEAKEREQQEAMRVFLSILADKNALVEFFEETRAKVEHLAAQRSKLSKAMQMRLVHTLKGNAAQQGIDTFARVCHDLESKLVDDADAELSAEDVAEVARIWSDIETRFKPLIQQDVQTGLDVTRAELDTAVAMAQSRQSHDAISEVLRSWQMEPVSQRLQRLGKVAEGVSERLGKTGLKIQINDNGIRIDNTSLRDFWASMVHVLRNAIDHGIEMPDERLAKGKAAHGTIALSAQREDGYVVIEVVDDGKGINWVALQDQAKRRNLPHTTPEDLVNALFADGVSTKEEVTDLSGRGVGMAAVRQSILRLGGSIKVRSQAGRGTRFSFRLPYAAVGGAVNTAKVAIRKAS